MPWVGGSGGGNGWASAVVDQMSATNGRTTDRTEGPLERYAAPTQACRWSDRQTGCALRQGSMAFDGMARSEGVGARDRGVPIIFLLMPQSGCLLALS